MSNESYYEILKMAKTNTIHAHAMTWIKSVVEEDDKTDRQKFEEVKKILDDAVSSLSE